ncbi:MAG: hypothetical protein ACR2MM_07830 [Flavobacteriaceae bacterium]
MSYNWRIISWKRCLALSIGVLLVLIIVNFYGLYTNKFYFFKVDNYIFPLLAIVHFSYLQAMHLKINNKIFSDPQLRNLEYALYAILLVYIFKATDTAYILLSYSEFETYFMPETFIPVGLGIFSFQVLLIILTIISFRYRRQLVGKYNFDHINDKLDSWQ